MKILLWKFKIEVNGYKFSTFWNNKRKVLIYSMQLDEYFTLIFIQIYIDKINSKSFENIVIRQFIKLFLFIKLFNVRKSILYSIIVYNKYVFMLYTHFVAVLNMNF